MAQISFVDKNKIKYIVKILVINKILVIIIFFSFKNKKKYGRNISHW